MEGLDGRGENQVKQSGAYRQEQSGVAMIQGDRVPWFLQAGQLFDPLLSH